ncbi:glycosyltransferase family 4 protein [Suillus fuscotomentosus]|uniref:Glycosyltransferase family 4 protein n=1 Tax=Suillus fuscotomentosus TaxID=1912939 RepID=A0AAD4HKI9_9AGAM|nr:glycosyltransferase family 4 protein [Suillus fuscotomentosus]KAG1899892.1 glycosyltransferase family 4 protein [Suillus fuscotomentosus]
MLVGHKILNQDYHAKRRLSSVDAAGKPASHAYSSLAPMWAGIAGALVNGGQGFEIVISIHDSVYNTDFALVIMPYTSNDPTKSASDIANHVLQTIKKFSQEHLCKFLGAGVTLGLLKECPNLCTHLWLEADIVLIVFNIKPFHTDSLTRPNIKHRISSTTGSYVPSGAETPTVYVDPSPLLDQNNLQSGVATKLPIPHTLDEQADSAARKCLMYYGPNNNPRLTIGPHNQVTVDAAGKIHLIDDLDVYRKFVGPDELREKKVKIGFFSSTPQGGGVALYVPNPSLSVFRTTKNNHNILQGVAAPDLRLTQEAKDQFDAWILKNGLRWTAEEVRPELPIIYRSHIEIHSDLVHVKGPPQEEVWKYLWKKIQLADLFISHPVSKFVPSDVPIEKLALLGAATDSGLDGLNKHLHPWDSQFYMAKGIPNVIDSYACLRIMLKESGRVTKAEVPQLLICGHGAVDDPDASIIYNQVMNLISSPDYKVYQSDIIVMRLPPSDQFLDALMANTKIALQLSLCEGFEVKVSEALHAGIPIVASHTGGIPLQIVHGKSGYLTETGNNNEVAKYLFNLYTDETLYSEMSEYAHTHVSDEVGTVENAAAWLYLAIQPHGAWLNDMLREETGEPYVEPGKPRLPRGGLNIQG